MNRLLKSSDLARISSPSCRGCGACCRDMGSSIRLDPYDIYLLTTHLGRSFEALLDDRIGLKAEDGLVLPYLLMKEKKGQAPCCSFLDGEGKCSVHRFRPGLCRLFPLGRDYDGSFFSYFVVDGACPMAGKTKVRIDRWLGYEDLSSYEKFTASWHYFIKDMKEAVRSSGNPESARQLALYILQKFYVMPWNPQKGFFAEFEERLALIRSAFA